MEHGIRTVGHIPENISVLVRKFLSLPKTSVQVKKPGPQMNRGAEPELALKFLDHKKAVDWVARNISDEEAKLTKRVDRCLKNNL